MRITVRPENALDAPVIAEVILRAFRSVSYSDHTEQVMVDRLRASSAYLPPLSMVAEIENQIVGHIMLTRVAIRDGETSFASLALAPLSVLPEFQNRGVGTALVKETHKRALHLGFPSVIVLGTPNYYSRFGPGLETVKRKSSSTRVVMLIPRACALKNWAFGPR